jgi:hypothetical protein
MHNKNLGVFQRKNTVVGLTIVIVFAKNTSFARIIFENSRIFRLKNIEKNWITKGVRCEIVASAVF